jgi:hypothetical protein
VRRIQVAGESPPCSKAAAAPDAGSGTPAMTLATATVPAAPESVAKPGRSNPVCGRREATVETARTRTGEHRSPFGASRFEEQEVLPRPDPRVNQRATPGVRTRSTTFAPAHLTIRRD